MQPNYAPNNAGYGVINDQEVKQWAKNHATYLHPSSENYDEDLANSFQAWTNQLDAQLYSAGRGDLILSPEYRQWADGFIRAYHENGGAENTNTQSRRLNMSSSRNTVAPVRSSAPRQQAPAQRNSVVLSAAERELARRIGVSDKEFAQAKMADVKEQQRKRADFMKSYRGR
jgi:hypothetical protein